MRLSICSYSFNRLLAAGKQDIFRYITDCKSFGCTQLDPWMAHLEPIQAGCEQWRNLPDAHRSHGFLASDEIRYLVQVRDAADRAGLPFGCIAVDGAAVSHAEESTANANRAIAYRWIDAAAILGANQIRIDSGGTPEMPPAEFDQIVAGYRDVVDRAAARGIEVLMENHWGASQYPANIHRIIPAVPGLGFLWDSYNFATGFCELGRSSCAKYATNTHLKTFTFDAQGNEPHEDIPHALSCLRAVNYQGPLGIESCSTDIDEYEGVRKTIALIHKYA